MKWYSIISNIFMKKLIKKMASIDENITPNLGVTESDDTVAL